MTQTNHVLILDNYDSFTYNLAQLVASLGADPVVIRNDAIDLNGIEALKVTHIVISPGPGRPSVARDFGICGDVIKHYGPTTPILGVCLGHQGIVHTLGGKVVQAPTIMHGKQSRIKHDGSGVFAGLSEPVPVMRYHSLIADRESLPSCLRITAETEEDGLIMGVVHKEWPMTGVQFHPESVGTPNGRTIMANFLRLSK